MGSWNLNVKLRNEISFDVYSWLFPPLTRVWAIWYCSNYQDCNNFATFNQQICRWHLRCWDLELWFLLLRHPLIRRLRIYLCLRSLHAHEWITVAQVPDDGDDPASNFSPVLDGGSVDVSILPLEQTCD